MGILHNDIQEARKKIDQLTAQDNSLESQQGGSDANEESNILDIIEDDKAEDTSLLWDYNMGSLLLGHQSEDYQSTPKPKEQLYNRLMHKIEFLLTKLVPPVFLFPYA